MAIPFINKIAKKSAVDPPQAGTLAVPRNQNQTPMAPTAPPVPLPPQPTTAPAAKPAQETKQPSSFFIDLRPRFITLPDVEDRKTINIRYPLVPPYATAHIYWDDSTKELVYDVEEPVLNNTERELLDLLQTALEEMINVSFIKTENIGLILQYLEKNVQSILIELGTKVSQETYNKIMYYVFRDSVGLNEIEPLMRDYYIEDIECNGDSYPIYIVHRKYANLKSNITFQNRQRLIDFIEKLAQRAGRYVSYARPLLDGTLPDGSRVNATYTEDVTTRGPTFTIRKFTKDPWTPVHLIKFGTVSAEALAFIWLALENKSNVMTIGETSSGKTTFMNSIANFIPPEARVCSIEDTREINLAHINWLPAVTRAGFGLPVAGGEQYGEITLFDLLRETFRQAPDYVILGETRGSETYVLFQGMASGHPSLSTFHANSVETMVRRFETPPISLPATLIESLDIVCVTTHVKTPEKSYRRMTELDEVIDVSPELGRVNYNKLFVWDPVNDKFIFNNKSVIVAKLSKRLGIPAAELEAEVLRRAALLKRLAELNVVEFKDVSDVINLYYKDKNSALKKFGVA